MLLKTKIFLAIAIVFLLHFLIVEYLSHSQIKQDVIEEIQAQARIVHGMLMALRRVYQDEFLNHDIPINEQTLELLPAHAITRISEEFRNWVMNGVSFNNVSEHPRNPGNQADEIEQEAIRYFSAHPQQLERLVPFTNAQGDDYFHYAQPIRVEPNCLKCHGSRDQVPVEIGQRYSTGFDFQVGELRGILSIKLPAKLVTERMAAALKQNTLTHLAGILFAFLMLSLLLNKTVIKPLVHLQQVTRRLYYGDYSVRASMREGTDEIAMVSRMFDKMVVKLAKRDKALNVQRALFAALAETNKLISRLDSPEKLFEQVCRISIDYAEVSFAWIGMINRDKLKLEPIASAAASGHCKILDVTLDKAGRSSVNSLVRAIAHKRPIIVDDLEKEPGVLDVVEGDQAKQIRSAAFFPIIKQGKVVGCFTLYALDKHFFTPQIQELLEEMAADLAFAMQHFQSKEEVGRDYVELQESSRQLSRANSQLRSLLESTGEGVYGEDMLGHCTFINQTACEMLGYAQEELIGKSIRELLPAKSRDQECEPLDSGVAMQAWVADDELSCEVYRRKDGSLLVVETAIHPVFENDQKTGAVTVFRDIAKRQEWGRKMNYLATHDHLSNLLNRYAFERLLQVAVDKARGYGSESVLCYMDLDQIKVVNDTCGHGAGDAMLKLLAQALQRNIQVTGKLARLGGEAFGLLLESCSLDEALHLAERLCEVVKDFRFTWRGKSFSTGINIGIVSINSEVTDSDRVMSVADAACYVAKEKGPNRVHVYRSYDREIVSWGGEVRRASDFQVAMQEQRLKLHCQAIERLDRQETGGSHFELLLRMTGSNGNDIPPQAFIPSAERFDQMILLDRWVIGQAFQWLSQDRKRLAGIGLCAINLSAQSLLDNSLYEYIFNELQRHGLPADKICFEICETAVLSRLDRCVVLMNRLKKLGFRIALDDFGTGMTSYSYLKQLPVDFLKIDGSFIKTILEDPINRAMVEWINKLAHLMGLQTIAESVENDWIRFELKKIGVDYVQGFGVARPGPLLQAVAQ